MAYTEMTDGLGWKHLDVTKTVEFSNKSQLHVILFKKLLTSY